MVMALGIFNIGAVCAEETSTITAYITVSKYGEIVNDKDGNMLAESEIELTDQSTYTLDDVFAAAHDLYYAGGADAGYASAMGEYGLYIKKFWGDESGNFGYQVNSGREAVMGLSHEVRDGDYIDVCIYKNAYPDTESYARFDKVKAEGYANETIELTLSQAGYDENWNTVFSPCADAVITVNGEAKEITTDADGKACISFNAAGEYIVSAVKTKEVDEQQVPAITAPVCAVTVQELPDAVITVPSDTELFVGLKDDKHFVSFTQMQPCLKKEQDGTSSYYFALNDNKTYNYRVTSDRYITYAGTFKKTADFSLNITDAMLETDGKGKTTVDRDTASINGYNVADIYLNINPQGYLKLDQGDTYQIVNLRNWEAVNNTIDNYFIEPDYHYAAIDENGNSSDCISIDKNGLITAEKEGTAIVLVAYDAINLNFGSGKVFYGAVWAENTGVFVVSVGAEDSGIVTGMTINEGKNSDTIKLAGDALDAEHDVIYFTGESGSYTFTPETKDVSVSVANPVVDTALSYNGFTSVAANADGSCIVPLKNGRNIVKIEKDGKAEYQVITAKKVNVTVNNGETVHPGDTVSIAADTLYHPANKLAGVYNMSANAIYTSVSGYDGKIIGGLSAQYNFASRADAQNLGNVLKEKNAWGVISYQKDTDLTVPEDYPYDTFVLSDGMFYVSGWGDPYGNHRTITYENGKGTNTNADARPAYLGRLPDIAIPITATTAELSTITLDTTEVKTDYYAGDSFDTSGLIVTAKYADETTQLATAYTVSPEILTADTDKVTVTYRGKAAEIPVHVAVPKVSAIAVTTAPTKTSYKAGDTFDPTGMVVTATYESGRQKAITDYSYAPNRELKTTDTEMIITYTGEDGLDGLADAYVPITVTTSSGGSGSGSSTITVSFTLYGDDKHGTPSGSANTHTMSANNLDVWLAKTSVTVDKGSYVIDAVKKVLSIAGIPYANENNYISSVKGLKEFDNGDLSGWMYTLNGKYPSLGIGEQKLSNGDKIVFHYTDDYTQEKSSVSGFGSSGGSGGTTTAYTVRFETNGGNTITSQSLNKNDTVTKPADPSRDGYNFGGWFTDEQLTKEYDFSEKVTGGFTLYAKWTEGTKESGNDNKLTAFADVEQGSWYEEAVAYAAENHLFSGVSETEFAPNSSMTRAMLVTVLYRLENSDEKGRAHRYTDVSDGEWYADAVSWAAESGIVNGVSETEFAPNDSITREQLAAVLYRYAERKGYETEEASALLQFADFDEISPYALDAMKWAYAKEMLKGVSETHISPKTTATRAQVAAILMRFCEKLAK